MRRGVWCIGSLMLALAFAVSAGAQTDQFAYRVTFRDKVGAPSVANASTYLSARALQRRAAYGIAVDSTDRPVSHLYLDTVLALTHGKLHNVSKWLNSCVILLTDSSKIHLIEAKPYVVSTTWVGYFAGGLHRPAAEENSTGNANKGTGTQTYYNNTWNQTSMVNGDYLHDIGLRGQGKLIAMLDLGFLGTDIHSGFDSLRNEGRLLDTWDFVRDSSWVYRYTGHGTAGLSVMAGNIPNTFIGSAPKAQYALYITDDVSVTDALYELDNTIAGMERADSVGADIITASLGYNEFFSPYYFLYPKSALDGKTTSVALAANMATSKGILFVGSAGNEGGNSWNFLLTPGDADSVLTVGAVDGLKNPAGFSSPGPNSSNRIKPDVCAQGDPALTFNTVNGIAGNSGTSFSTPQIAGWAACLLQGHPHATPYEIRTAIDASADHYTAPTAKLGYGIPNFMKAHQSLYVVDVYKEPITELVPYPNPVKNSFAVELPGVGATSYSLYDAAGKLILNQAVKMSTPMLSVAIPQSMPIGVYTLSVQQNGKAFRARILKD